MLKTMSFVLLTSQARELYCGVGARMGEVSRGGVALVERGPRKYLKYVLIGSLSSRVAVGGHLIMNPRKSQ